MSKTKTKSESAQLENGDGDSTSEKKPQNSGSKWLSAWNDPVAGIKATTACVRLADLHGDQDSKLLIADIDRKLKLYKGTTLVSEHVLMGAPTAICTYYPDASVPRTPVLAVASGPIVFIYRNMRPYNKFVLPDVDIESRESEIWSDLRNDKMEALPAYEALVVLRDGGSTLTSRSLDLLALEEPAAIEAFVATNKPQPLQQQSVVTCMETIRKNVEEEDGITQLVIGAENRNLYIMDPAGTSVLQAIRLKSTPVMMAITGLYDVEYRIVVACRDGNIYTVKGGEVLATVIELESQVCGLVRCLKNIIVGCMGNVIHSYHIKGKKNFSLTLPAPITNMEVMSSERARNVNAVLVAMSNGEIRVYNEKNLVSTLQVEGIVTGMRFGRFAREDTTLILVFKSGALSIKILPRNSNLERNSLTAGPPPEQDIPLNVPKKTRLYVEQTQRERDQGVEIHRIFQRDLCKLRLATARAYVKVLTDGQGPLSYTAGSSLRLNASVQGLGPFFKLKLSIQNTGSKPIQDTPVTFSYNRSLYYIRQPLFRIPILVPGPFYKYEADVECLDKNGCADSIRIFVCSAASIVPIISAVVNMPISELLLDQ